MEIPITFPIDNDGFLRRECPWCEEEFKWHNGALASRPEDAVDPPAYYCPLCGRSAEPNQWFTQAQVQYQQETVQFHLTDTVGDELAAEFKSSRTMKFKKARNTAPAPNELTEPDDMIIVEPPCHPWEPVKAPENRVNDAPMFCLICGAQYAA